MCLNMSYVPIETRFRYVNVNSLQIPNGILGWRLMWYGNEGQAFRNRFICHLSACLVK